MQKPRTQTVVISDAARGAYQASDPQALHRALSLAPWTPSPLTVEGPYPPSWVAPSGSWAQEWKKAWHLRQELEKAA